MYSDMSTRIIACSESNMNSASARASSVLPTPVGPRNRNEPIGRSGSCRPAPQRPSAGAPPLGLADAVGSEEKEGADRAVGVLQAGSRAPQRGRDRLDRLVLADD